MAGMGNFRYNIEWGAAAGATLYEIFHHEHSYSPACNAMFFSQHCHVIGVEKRDFKAHMKRRFVHGTVVTGSHVAPLHTIIFHEIDYYLLSFCKDTKLRPPFASFLRRK